MAKKFLLISFISIFAFISIAPAVSAEDLAERVSGYILLQVEENGEAWYVYPEDNEKYYMGRPADAFKLMRELGLGIKHSELTRYLNYRFPSRLSGMIMLDVEQNGEAYYVYPKDLKGYYLGRPDDAFNLMRSKGLGISNSDLAQIKININHAMTIDLETLDQAANLTGEIFGDSFEANVRLCFEEKLGPDYGTMTEDEARSILGDETDTLMNTCFEQALANADEETIVRFFQSLADVFDELSEIFDSMVKESQ